MSGRSGARAVWLPLAAYVVLVSALALTHDMWRDEVRAFSVATRAPSWGAMLGDLSEEGHPFVWYAILRAGYALTGSEIVLPVAAIAIGVIVAWLILRYAPFTLPVRLLCVFGAFLGYELSVVARNYGVGVLFMVAACIFFPRRIERPWPLAISLALLANTSVHGALASALLFLLWAADAMDRDRRVRLLRLSTAAAALVVSAAIFMALATARPPAGMTYAFDMSVLDPLSVARALMIDPGQGLKGANGADILAAGELPWSRLGLDAVPVARFLVNIALLSVAWALRSHRRVLIVFALAIAGFEILFRLVYTGGLRHEALLAFLIVSLCWIAIVDSPDAIREDARRRISIGLLPLLAVQAAALPFTAFRHAIRPESAAAQLAVRIERTPQFRNAILMSEPDVVMETLPYYVRNPVFMPRQREFDYRVYFDNGAKRQETLNLGELLAIADSVGCASNRPVLLSIGHRRFLLSQQGEAWGPYRSSFRWTAEQKAEFRRRAVPLQWFRGAMGDENYRTFFLSRLPPGACGSISRASSQGR